MPSLGNTPRPAYAYDTATDTWIPLGIPEHTHSDYASLPPQTGESGKVLQTNGSTLSWVSLPNGYSIGNTASRPSSPVVGQLYSNTQNGYLEIYTASGWSQLGVIPGIPTIGTATDIGTSRAFNNAGVVVTFTPNATGGLASSFTTTSTSGGYSASGSSSPITVTGIPSNTALTFTVAASNGYGNSLSSTASNSVTATTVPQSPTLGTATNPSGTAFGSTAIGSVPFTAGATGGKAITNYKWSTDGITYTAFSPAQTSSPLLISGLNSGQTYTFYLRAVNSNGDSLAAGPSNSVTLSTVPANPTLGTPTINSTTSVSIPFTAGSNGNSNITGYTITSSPAITLSYNTTQVTSPITVTGTFIQGVSYTFNVKANNLNGSSTGVNSSAITPFPFASVSGGTLASDATYYYRTFTSTGNLSVSNASLACDYLVIAGGGGGGNGMYYAYTTVFISRGSGGGAGGIRAGNATLSPGTYTATVGAGSSNSTALGSSSSFNALSSTGGSRSNSGETGGSGGGVQGYQGTYSGVYNSGNGAPGTAGQGNRGGNIGGSGTSSASGGGGAGAAGGDTTTNGTMTAAGAGTNSYSSWATATSTGVGGFYAGGGAAQTLTGGSGGGGNGGATGQFGGTGIGGNGTANTGGGGGGGGQPGGTGGVQFSTNAGGTGGSGLVIVRYTRAQVGG